MPNEAGVVGINAEGRWLYGSGYFEQARSLFALATALADTQRDTRASAMNRNNMGACDIATMQYGAALRNLTEARAIAERAGQMLPLAYTLTNLANLYVLTGQYETGLRVAKRALESAAGRADAALTAKLTYQVSTSLVHLDRLEEGRPYHLQAVGQLANLKQYPDVVRLLTAWGNGNLKAGNLVEAQKAFAESWAMVQTHHLSARASLLTGLAKLRQAEGQPAEAEKLFGEALSVTEDRTPRWRILADRAQFRLETGNDAGALGDFREARAIALRVRADMVPADQDRVAFESGIGEFLRGLVDAGNRIATKTGDPRILEDTFDAAEQDRLWSLRSLLPATNDWRTRLTPVYWEKLARYQALQRRILTSGGKTGEAEADELRFDLQQLEQAAGSWAAAAGDKQPDSALAHARSLLDSDTVLLSFHTSPTGSWVWSVDEAVTRVFALPPEGELKASVDAFARSGYSADAGRVLYSRLFGALPASVTLRKRWLLEPDGPLHEVPFAALVVSEKNGQPVFLIEKTSLQTVPGSILLRKRAFRSAGRFVGISDPVYNHADSRFQGRRRAGEFSLPRLPGSSSEVAACVNAWGSPQNEILAGMGAGLEKVREAVAGNPAVIHFATHVIRGNGEHRSGLIALSLGASGEMGLLGPQEILARPFTSELVVMDGCHSAQAETVSSSGRMGLTRAWLGAGAVRVLATQWDVDDRDAQAVMTTFYTALRRSVEKGPAAALQEAQIAALQNDRTNPLRWAGYYLLSGAI